VEKCPFEIKDLDEQSVIFPFRQNVVTTNISRCRISDRTKDSCESPVRKPALLSLAVSFEGTTPVSEKNSVVDIVIDADMWLILMQGLPTIQGL
jgi:hypothetical protein